MLKSLLWQTVIWISGQTGDDTFRNQGNYIIAYSKSNSLDPCSCNVQDSNDSIWAWKHIRLHAHARILHSSTTI